MKLKEKPKFISELDVKILTLLLNFKSPGKAPEKKVFV